MTSNDTLGPAPQIAELIAAVEKLHRHVDTRVEQLMVVHAKRMRCGRGCIACCDDELSVFEVEARLIEHHHPSLLGRELPHPTGACAFLSGDGSCRIYASRPYVCRTQGLPLRWIDAGPDGQDAEYRDICELNEEEPSAPPITELTTEECWTIGPVEAELQALQRAHGGAEQSELRRVALRSLFLATNQGEK